MPTRLGRISLGALLLSALLIRLGWALAQPAVVDARLPDQVEYLETARNLLDGRGLSFLDVRFGQVIYAYRTPGYPLFLAACGGSVRMARIAQALIDTSTVLAIYFLARRWMDGRAALLAGALVAFNPFLVYFSGLLLSETLFTALLAWGMVLLVARPNYLWGGVALALSVLVRPAAVALPVMLGLAAVFVSHAPGEPDRRRWWKLPVGATMVLLVALTLLPWAVRNYYVLGRWVWLTTNAGVTRYDGFNPEATGQSNQKFLQEREMALVAGMTEVDRDEYFSSLADRYIKKTWSERPVRLLELTAKKVARTWSPIPLSDDFGRPAYRAVALVFSIPLDVLAVCGLWAGRLRRSERVFLLCPAVYFTIVHALSVGSLRYRVPVEPMLAVLAAAGAMVLFVLLRRPTWRRGADDAERRSQVI